jgi:DNA-binding XRE family transcriptional regulator
MESGMKVSPSLIRRLRIERGWSQDQLALASGVSLRTIQRVEAEGMASTSTAVSIAATYNLKLSDLQENQSPTHHPQALHYGLLLSGFAIITLAAIAESGRMPGPGSEAIALIYMFTAIIGVLLLLPAFFHSIRHRQYIAVALAALGAQLTTLSALGAVYALVNGVTFNWVLVTFGVGGAGLLIMAVREFRRSAGSLLNRCAAITRSCL